MSVFLRQSPAIVLGVILGAMLAWGHSVLADRSDTGISHLPLEDLQTFSEIFTRIKEDYVEEVSDEELLENAIKGMLSGLDPHSSYLTPDAFKDLQVGTSGEFGGLGIEVGMEDGFVKVIAPIDDTPAQRAGIQAGDLIIRLDKTPVKGMTLTDAVKVMRGKPGTDINLTVIREGEDRPLQIDITRAIIQVKSVKRRLLEAGYGYVRISQFQSRTRDDLHEAINDLKEENKGELKALVLDLRNNPGGVLNAAVEVSDTFLEKGMIVYTEGRVRDAELKFRARPKDILDGAPIVVLVNGGSASASEIVAGALQDHKRAVIMGSRTFGKGSVQTILPMNNQSALKMTTARYYTPSGRSIQAEGIEPDITIDRVKVETFGDAALNLSTSEVDLSGHLEGDSEKENGAVEQDTDGDNSDIEANTEEKDANDKAADKIPLIQSDYALYQALSLLKGLNILSAQR